MNLFPITEPVLPEKKIRMPNEVKFGRSWAFDFEKGDFIQTPTGKMLQTEDVDAWCEWCRKALSTMRYRHPIYDNQYGEEYPTLIGKGRPQVITESEIRRMTTECLMVDPRTDKVEGFSFEWTAPDTVWFECTISNRLGDTRRIGGTVVICEQ